MSAGNKIGRSRDIRRVADDERWSKEAIDSCVITFKQYLDPQSTPADPFDIPVIAPQREAAEQHPDVGGTSRRMMLRPVDFREHG